MCWPRPRSPRQPWPQHPRSVPLRVQVSGRFSSEPAVASPLPANAQLLLAEVRAGDNRDKEGGHGGWVSQSQHPQTLAHPVMERWLVLACVGAGWLYRGVARGV